MPKKKKISAEMRQFEQQFVAMLREVVPLLEKSHELFRKRFPEGIPYGWSELRPEFIEALDMGDDGLGDFFGVFGGLGRFEGLPERLDDIEAATKE